VRDTPSRSGRDRGIHVSGAAVYDGFVCVAQSHLTIVVDRTRRCHQPFFESKIGGMLLSYPLHSYPVGLDQQ
jgi:hypothetical protein